MSSEKPNPFARRREIFKKNWLSAAAAPAIGAVILGACAISISFYHKLANDNSIVVNSYRPRQYFTQDGAKLLDADNTREKFMEMKGHGPKHILPADSPYFRRDDRQKPGSDSASA